MFTAKRSSDFKIQWAIYDFEASLHQKKAETATTNEKAKAAHSRKASKGQSKVCQGHDKSQIWVLYGHSRGQGREMYWAGRIGSHLLRSPKRKCGCFITSVCHALLRTHRTYVGIGSTCTLRTENKSCQDFLIVHQAVLHQAPQTLKDDLHSSYSLLLGPSFSTCQSLVVAPASQAGGQPLSIIPLKSELKQSLPPKRWHSSTEAQVDTSMDEDFPTISQEE